jgi:hypothetical protein
MECTLAVLIILLILSFVVLVWVVYPSREIPELLPLPSRIYKDEIGRLVFANYRPTDLTRTYSVDVAASDITIVSGCIDANGERSWAEISKRRVDEYVSIHGYNTMYFTKKINREAPAIWQKIYAVRKALRTSEVVVWVDDDLVITTPQRPIEDFLAMTDKALIFSRDLHPCPDEEHPHRPEHYWNVINTGIFIIRRTPASLAFLDDVIEGRTSLFNGYFSEGNFHEQTIITYLLYTKYLEDFALMPLGYLQSINKTKTWRPEHFSLHFAGEKASTRYHLMESIYNNTVSC